MSPSPRAEPPIESQEVRVGAEVLVDDGFSRLKGRRIGLITNHTGLARGERLIDVMARTPGISLAAILTPEHGLSGSAEAGATVAGGTDAKTGIKVLSLYGATHRPTPAMLADLDLLVFDMQDIGTRFYTYISTMGLAMQAAAAARLPFLVLDRPNPLGGETVAGFVLEKRFASFVGRYEIPIQHGLTVGELARMIKGEQLLDGLAHLTLDVIRCEGWSRDKLWPATARPWVATSPNIPTFETALAYPGTGLFEATTASEGRGTAKPFLIIGHAAVSGTRIAEKLSSAGLPGIRFAAEHATPHAIPGVATTPRFRGRTIDAVSLTISDPARFRPVEAGLHLLAAFVSALHASGAGPLVTDAKAFNRLVGTDRLATMLRSPASAADLIAASENGLSRFRERRAAYLLYR